MKTILNTILEDLESNLSNYLDLDSKYRNKDIKAFCLEQFEDNDADFEEFVEKHLEKVIKEAIRISVEGYADGTDAEMPSDEDMEKLMIIRLCNTDEARMIVDQIIEKLVEVDD